MAHFPRAQSLLGLSDRRLKPALHSVAIDNTNGVELKITVYVVVKMIVEINADQVFVSSV